APGSRRAPALRPGAWIDPARTAGAVGLDELVSVLDADTRAQAQVVLGQLAVGLRGRSGALRDAVLRLDRALDPARQVTHALPAPLDGARAAAPDFTRAARALRTLGGRGARPLRDARRSATALGPTARTLAPALHDGRTILAAVDRRRDGIGLLGERFSGVLSTNDANG